MSTPTRAQPRTEPARPEGDGNFELRNYRLSERIGQDELSTVYRGAHISLDRPVHVHLLRRTDWISVSRFQLAGKLAARLSHPGLLPVDDAGHDDRYGYYLVTPAIEGKSLAKMLSSGPVQPVQALKIATQIATTLDYLHTQKVIHRDLQPANVIVNPQGVAYLTNLSLAASPDTPDLSSIDEADYVTPYSAPEQRLQGKDAAPTLDVYSLGALLYHMLSGKAPPASGTTLPSLGSRDAALSSADRIIQRMMAVKPEGRFPSPGAAIAALRQSLRALIDLATDDMEESRWEASAEWLENPLETAIGQSLDEKMRDYVARSRRRADEIHRRDAIRRLLNRWSRGGQFRRQSLGQILQPEQITSYNVYYYELHIAYESRSAAAPRQRPFRTEDRPSTLPSPDVWKVTIPELPADQFEPVAQREVVVPNTLRQLRCPDCSGAGKIPCEGCKGRGTVEQISKVKGPDGREIEEKLLKECPKCRGYARLACGRCGEVGSLTEEQFFNFSRRAKVWESTDDFDDLPRMIVQKRLEVVYEATINPYGGQWPSVAPLAKLIRTATTEAGSESRIVGAKLKISAAPITEVAYNLDEKPGRLYLIGFDDNLVGTWSLLNTERVALAAIGGVFVVVLLIIILFAIF